MPTQKNNPRKSIYIAVVAAILIIVIGVVLALTQPWRAFTSSTVDEAFPSVAPVSDSGKEPPIHNPEATVGSDETVAPVAPIEIKGGQFISLDHDTSGTAFIAELPDGSRVLRLENLASLDGPDLKVVLTSQTGNYADLDASSYTSLGALKATHGNQNYTIPQDVDLADVNSVVIWCERFTSPFGAAELTAS
ncbi:DM13 domain-containing protein [Corynebacterium sp. CCM 9204]|uniref:DM13 domain-containing protein n=1 Tax=Corynebacterium sp. CCM 9204 TaxID=3057616 RepID=UPI003523657D